MTESVIYAAVFLEVILGFIWFQSQHSFTVVKDIVENQSLAHEEKNTWVKNH